MPKQDGIDTVMTPDKFRTAKRRRFVADFSIQMILRDSLALITTVTLSQLKDCTSHRREPFVDFVLNSFSFWLQISHLNVAVVRV